MELSRLKIGFVVMLLAAGSAGCSQSPSSTPSQESAAGTGGGRVVVYSSVDEVFAAPICQQFEAQTGIKVDLVPDTEETKSTGLLNRLIAEKERPQADVFWSGDPVRAAVLKSRGISAAYTSPAAGGLPAGFSDPQGHWTCFSARARVLVYNKDLVPEEDRPTSVHDLTDPRFKGRACMANPLFGTTSMHAAALFQVLGDEEARSFFESLRENEVGVLSSNGEVRRRVANGEFAIGLTDSDDVNVAIQEGRPVGFVYPDAEGMGTLVMPNAAVLISGGPNPENGKRFVDFLLRPDTEAALAASEAAQMPLRSDAELPPGFPFQPVTQFKAMSVDYQTLAAKLEELSAGFLKEWVDKQP